MGAPQEYDTHDFPVSREVGAQQGSPLDYVHNPGKENWRVNSQAACPRAADFDIFRNLISMEDQVVLFSKLRMLYHNGTSNMVPALAVPMPDLEALSRRCLSWITNEGNHATHDTSIIALLTSQPFAVALRGHIDPALVSTLQDFLFSTTLAYTSWRDHHPPPQRLSVRDLHRISHLTGSALLHKLDRFLNQGSLASVPRSTLQALFLVVFGTTLGVAYSTSVGSGPPVIRTDLLTRVLRESPTLWMAMKERLCHLLADDLLALASTLRLQFDPRAARDSIVDGCLMGRWHRTGQWVWASAARTGPACPPRQRAPEGCWPPAAAEGAGVVDGPAGLFVPAPQAARMPCPEVLGPMFPAMDGADAGKRRTMIVVGPSCDGQQMYARMRAHTGSDGPSLFV
ncbi:hypothetical protein VSDG_01584 [Cytospora chrysosperma]|uniref:Uncharacterized protein n=1 Tax=Cytospora chrysosperma TaxID=252740 RepID=A0A423WJE1_CYTCH|nr:hypothetical protein VSDG_01584 [Valsa sordida]